MKLRKGVFSFLVFLFGFIGCQSDTKKETVEVGEILSPDVDSLSIAEENMKWKGTWEREGSLDPATLLISDANSTSFQFNLSTHDGANVEEIQGKAVIEGSLALYLHADTNDTCQINFVLQDSILVVNQPQSCDPGNELDFSGEYYLDHYIKEKVMQEDAEERNVVD